MTDRNEFLKGYRSFRSQKGGKPPPPDSQKVDTFKPQEHKRSAFAESYFQYQGMMNKELERINKEAQKAEQDIIKGQMGQPGAGVQLGVPGMAQEGLSPETGTVTPPTIETQSPGTVYPAQQTLLETIIPQDLQAQMGFMSQVSPYAETTAGAAKGVQEFLESPAGQLVVGPGTQRMLEVIPGGRYLKEEEQRAFSRAPIGAPEDIPLLRWLRYLGPGGTQAIEKDFFAEGKPREETKVSKLAHEARLATEWTAFPYALRGTRLAIAAHAPKLNKLLFELPLENIVKNSKLLKQVSNLIGRVRARIGKGKTSEQKAVTRELKDFQDNLGKTVKKEPGRPEFTEVEMAATELGREHGGPQGAKIVMDELVARKKTSVPVEKVKSPAPPKPPVPVERVPKLAPPEKPVVKPPVEKPAKAPAQPPQKIADTLNATYDGPLQKGQEAGFHQFRSKADPSVNAYVKPKDMTVEKVRAEFRKSFEKQRQKVPVEIEVPVEPLTLEVGGLQTIYERTRDIVKKAGAVAGEIWEADMPRVGGQMSISSPYTQGSWNMAPEKITTQAVKQKMLDNYKLAKEAGGQAIRKVWPEGEAYIKDPTAKGMALETGGLQTMYEYAAKALKRSKSAEKPTAIATIKGAEDATKVEHMYNVADKELARLREPTIKGAYEKLKRATVDVSGNVKRELLNKGGQAGKEAVIHHDLARGAHSKAETQINEATKKIFEGLSKEEEILLNRVVQSRRTIAIEKYKPGIKHPSGLGSKEHQSYLETLPKETLKKLNERADKYFFEMQHQLEQLREAGLISKKSYDTLISKGDYSPRKFIQYIDPERSYNFSGRKITVPDSGIMSLKEGDYAALENNARSLLSTVVVRTQHRIFKNNANRSLYELATQTPENGVVSLAKVIRKTKAGKIVYQKAPAGHSKISVMIEGQHKEMIMPDKWAREWVESDPAVSVQVANLAGWLSGSKILKPMATGLNPEFALTNLPRDIAHMWLVTEEYSPTLFKAAPQIATDFMRVTRDTFLRKGSWIDYINQGGGMEFLTHQGRITRGGGALATLQKALGYIGETSEIWTRLAVRNRALRNGKSPTEATWIARNYIDFSQGGNIIKAIDTGVPYLNAGIQGTRGIVKTAIEHPAIFTYKVAQIGTLASGLYLANKYTNPECWESIRTRDKVNSWVITTPFVYKDKTGKKRHVYFKIAKDQGQRVFASIFEGMMGKYLGDEVDGDQIAQAVQDFIPIIPTQTVPPSIDAMLGYFANKDFWRNEDIWRGPEVLPGSEYTKYTHPAFIKFGEVTKMSPERTRYALQQYFTYGNIYTAIVGRGVKAIMGELPEEIKEKTSEEFIKNLPFARRIMGATLPYTKHEKALKEERTAEADRRYRQQFKFDELSENYYKEETKENRAKVFDFIKTQTVTDRDRLFKRFLFHKKVYQMPNKRWWLQLSSMPPETRANVYWNRHRNASKEERTQLENQLKKVPQIKSGRFYYQLSKLKRKLIKKGE